jgi:hypothetical protein
MNFLIKGKQLEIVQSYKYLGITFRSSGTFSVNIKELYTKATRVYFTIRSQLLKGHILRPDIVIKLFNSMVKPITLYGCEIWGADCLKLLENPQSSKLDKFPFQMLQIKMCKHTLSVGRNTSNLASRCELGVYPLVLDILKASLGHWSWVKSLPESRIVKQAHLWEVEQITKCPSSSKHLCMYNIQQPMIKADLNEIWENCEDRKERDVIIQKSLNHFRTKYDESIPSQLES